jgi:MFS family permease
VYVSKSRGGVSPPASSSGSGSGTSAIEAAVRVADVAESAPRRASVPRNVFALGAVSLFTDVSSEMITSVLGYYLLVYLQVSTIAVGFLDGFYSAVPVLLAVAAAYLADRYQRRKLLAGLGYGLSAVSKLGFPLVGGSVGGLGLVQGADRLGKGLRTAPRDALISLSAPPEIQGRAFGVHRAMDTAGAFLGPLVAMAAFSVAVTAQAFTSIFVTSFCVACIGLLTLALFVTDHREPAGDGRSARPALRSGLVLLRRSAFRRVCVAGTLLALVWISDTFVYLVLQQRLHLTAIQFAMLAVGTSGVYLLLAVPLGRIADRIGRWRVFYAGHAALLAVYLLLAGPVGGALLAVVTLAFHGLYYAATDGVLMAHAGPMLPPELRTSGLAVLQSLRALGAFCSSIAFGFAWAYFPAGDIALFFAAGLVVMLAAAGLLVDPRRPTTEAAR